LHKHFILQVYINKVQGEGNKFKIRSSSLEARASVLPEERRKLLQKLTLFMW